MFKFIKDKTEELELSNRQLQKKVESLQYENGKLQQEMVFRKYVDKQLEESKPQSAQEREKYMADVTIFYNNILKKKLAEMIREQQSELSRMDLSDKFTDIIRSNINCLNLIIDWFERCQVEHLGDLQNKRENQSEEGAISRLKSNLN